MEKGQTFLEWEADGIELTEVQRTSANVTFTMPETEDGVTLIAHSCYAAPDDWSAETTNYSMTCAAAVLMADGSYLTSKGSVLAFFDAAGNCCGKATKEDEDNNVFSGMIKCSQAEVSGITMKVWDGARGVALSVDETMDFVDGESWGDYGELAEVHAAHRVYVDGSCLSWYEEGATVEIDATPAGDDMEFDYWEAEGITLKDTKAVKLSFTMPANTVSLVMHYVQLYPVFVKDEVEDWHKVGEQVSITAAVPDNMLFEYWSGDGIELSEEQESSNPLVFTMPAGEVSLIPHFANVVQWTLTKGWNWVACNVTPHKADVNEVLAGYAAGDKEQIKGQNGYSTYYASKKMWYPPLDIEPGRMYSIQKTSTGKAVIKIIGTKQASDAVLELVEGWNWIGCFTDADAIAVSDLRFSNEFEKGNQLKGEENWCSYGDNDSWQGQLKSLEVGKGYKLKVEVGGTLYTEEGATRGSDEDEPCTRASVINSKWGKPRGYAYNMTMDAVVKLEDGSYLEAEGSMLAVLDSAGECRGVCVIQKAFGDSLLYSMTIGSDATTEEGLVLAAWNEANQRLYDIEETLTFTADTQLGDALEPKEWNAVGMGNVSDVLQLKAGWNLIALTMTPDEAGAQELLKLHPMALINGVHRLATAEQLVAGQPLWIYSSTARNVTLAGTGQYWTLQLKRRWNFIGIPEAIEQLPDNVESIWQWNGSAFVLTETVTPGNGYWFYCR